MDFDRRTLLQGTVNGSSVMVINLTVMLFSKANDLYIWQSRVGFPTLGPPKTVEAWTHFPFSTFHFREFLRFLGKLGRGHSKHISLLRGKTKMKSISFDLKSFFLCSGSQGWIALSEFGDTPRFPILSLCIARGWKWFNFALRKLKWDLKWLDLSCLENVERFKYPSLFKDVFGPFEWALSWCNCQLWL